mgnify:CR=1 FL=1
MSNITFHRRRMTAVPTDLLLDPTISIEQKHLQESFKQFPRAIMISRSSLYC